MKSEILDDIQTIENIRYFFKENGWESNSALRCFLKVVLLTKNKSKNDFHPIEVFQNGDLSFF